MADETKVQEKKEVKQLETFYLVPKDGGFQARKVIIEEDVVLQDEPFGDPDAWDQVMAEIEHEMSKDFQ